MEREDDRKRSISRPQQRNQEGEDVTVLCSLSITLLSLKIPPQMSFISTWYKILPRTTKVNSVRLKQKSSCMLFFPFFLYPRSPWQMQIPAQVESWAQNQIQLMLSQPINIETFQVTTERALPALYEMLLVWTQRRFSNISSDGAVVWGQRSPWLCAGQRTHLSYYCKHDISIGHGSFRGGTLT